MRPIFFMAPAMLAIATVSGSGAAAAHRGVYPPVQNEPAFRVQYSDCHNRTHNHYVPEWGFSAPHHHVRPYCRPVQDENDSGGYRGYYYDDDDYYGRDRPRHRRQRSLREGY